MIQGKYDIGLVHLDEDVFKNQNELVYEVLFRGQILANVKKDSYLALNDSIAPEELLKESFVLYKEESITGFANDFMKQFGPLNILFISDNAETVRSAVSEGLAITLGIDFTLQNSPNVLSGRTVSLPIANYEQPAILVGWVQNKKNNSSFVISEFKKRLRSELSQSNIKNYLYY